MCNRNCMTVQHSNCRQGSQQLDAARKDNNNNSYNAYNNDNNKTDNSNSNSNSNNSKHSKMILFRGVLEAHAHQHKQMLERIRPA